MHRLTARAKQEELRTLDTCLLHMRDARTAPLPGELANHMLTINALMHQLLTPYAYRKPTTREFFTHQVATARRKPVSTLVKAGAVVASAAVVATGARRLWNTHQKTNQELYVDTALKRRSSIDSTASSVSAGATSPSERRELLAKADEVLATISTPHTPPTSSRTSTPTASAAAPDDALSLLCNVQKRSSEPSDDSENLTFEKSGDALELMLMTINYASRHRKDFESKKETRAYTELCTALLDNAQRAIIILQSDETKKAIDSLPANDL